VETLLHGLELFTHTLVADEVTFLADEVCFVQVSHSEESATWHQLHCVGCKGFSHVGIKIRCEVGLDEVCMVGEGVVSEELQTIEDL